MGFLRRQRLEPQDISCEGCALATDKRDVFRLYEPGLPCCGRCCNVTGFLARWYGSGVKLTDLRGREDLSHLYTLTLRVETGPSVQTRLYGSNMPYRRGWARDRHTDGWWKREGRERNEANASAKRPLSPAAEVPSLRLPASHPHLSHSQTGVPPCKAAVQDIIHVKRRVRYGSDEETARSTALSAQQLVKSSPPSSIKQKTTIKATPPRQETPYKTIAHSSPSDRR